MKVLYIVCFVFALSQVFVNQNAIVAYADVYICNSKNGKKYHFKKNCRGLNACKAEIKKLPLADAKKKGKTLCGWED